MSNFRTLLTDEELDRIIAAQVERYDMQREWERRRAQKRYRQNHKTVWHKRVCTCGIAFKSINPNTKYCVDCRGKTWRRRSIIAVRRRRARQALANGSHTEAQWQERLKEQGWTCYYCGTELTVKNWSRDHRIPLYQGGSDNIDNIVAACRRCNFRKGTLSAAKYIEKLEYENIVKAQGGTLSCGKVTTGRDFLKTYRQQNPVNDCQKTSGPQLTDSASLFSFPQSQSDLHSEGLFINKLSTREEI